MLVDKLDSHDALLILRVLETLEQPSSTSPTKEEVQAEGELLTSMPQAAQEALARGDEVAFRQAFEVLLPEEQRRVATVLEALLHWREAAGEEEGGADTSFLSQFEPLLQAMAAIASGEAAQRHEIEQVLTELEAQGWHLKQAVERLWVGERDAGVLTKGLDE